MFDKDDSVPRFFAKYDEEGRLALAWQRVLAGLLALILVASGLSADLATAPGAAAEEAPVATDVDPLPSEDESTEVPPAPEGDFTGEPKPVEIKEKDPVASIEDGTIKGFDEKASNLVDRSEFADEYLNKDGTRTSAISETPVNIEDPKSEGDWIPIETHVAKGADGGDEIIAHPLKPRFRNTANRAGVLTVRGEDNKGLLFTLEAQRNRICNVMMTPCFTRTS